LPHIALKSWIVTDATGTLGTLFGRPREALRPRPRIRPRGVMEYWSTAPSRNWTPRPRVGSAFRAQPRSYPGL